MLEPNSDPRDHSFVPIFPLHWLALVCEADAYPALPLLLAIRRQFAMKEKGRQRKRKVITLSAEIWEAAGYPSGCARKRALRHLRKLSSIVVMETAQTFTARYCARKGQKWNYKGLPAYSANDRLAGIDEL